LGRTKAEPAVKGGDRDHEDGGHAQTRSATSLMIQPNRSVAMFPALFHRHARVEAVTGRGWVEGEIGSPARAGTTGPGSGSHSAAAAVGTI
jgi:hypothetical protein